MDNNRLQRKSQSLVFRGSDNPNCYYKQLQRKEQECENNKIAYETELNVYNTECESLQAQLKDTLEECENLKEENKQYKHLAEQHLKDYFECYKALEEIEEFCLVYRDNPVEGSAYKKILDIITKEKEQE